MVTRLSHHSTDKRRALGYCFGVAAAAAVRLLNCRTALRGVAWPVSMIDIFRCSVLQFIANRRRVAMNGAGNRAVC